MDFIAPRLKKYELLTKETLMDVDADIIATQEWIRNVIKGITYMPNTKCEKCTSKK